MAANLPTGATLGADKGCDVPGFWQRFAPSAALRALGVTTNVALNRTHRRSAIDDRTARHPGYYVSQHKRTLLEEIFGWAKTAPVGVV